MLSARERNGGRQTDAAVGAGYHYDSHVFPPCWLRAPRCGVKEAEDVTKALWVDALHEWQALAAKGSPLAPPRQGEAKTTAGAVEVTSKRAF